MNRVKKLNVNIRWKRFQNLSQEVETKKKKSRKMRDKKISSTEEKIKRTKRRKKTEDKEETIATDLKRRIDLYRFTKLLNINIINKLQMVCRKLT